MLNIVTKLLEGGLETRHFKGLFLKTRKKLFEMSSFQSPGACSLYLAFSPDLHLFVR